MNLSDFCKIAAINTAKFILQVLYRICCVRKRKNKVLLVSRQSSSPSSNFIAIGTEFEKRDWEVMYLTKRLTKRSIGSYAVHVIKEVWELACCRVCVLDRYDPVVSLLNFKCDSVSIDDVCKNYEVPVEPVVLQIWHAFGAYKKFGYESSDTAEGHSSWTLDVFRIHRNYSWIICTGEENRLAYAGAFSCPLEKIVPLGLPEYDELIEIKLRNSSMLLDDDVAVDAQKMLADRKKLRVLFAPTLRKSESTEHPFKDLMKNESLKKIQSVELVWSFHPLDTGGEAPGGLSSSLLESDYVVTDYSSIVYEAYLLGKKVVFYVPDIDTYRISPGLYADPVLLSPNITFTKEPELVKYLDCLGENGSSYLQPDLDNFVGGTFKDCSFGTARRIVDFAINQV